MRIDKLTTKFQEALSEAQSIALAKDNQYIEPAHVLLAMLRDSDGAAKSLLTRAGVNVSGLEKGIEKIISNLPEVQGTSGEVQVGRDLRVTGSIYVKKKLTSAMINLSLVSCSY